MGKTILEKIKAEVDIKKLVALGFTTIACNMSSIITPDEAAECYMLLHKKLGFPPFQKNLDDYSYKQGWLIKPSA